MGGKLTYEDEASYGCELIVSDILKWIELNTDKEKVTKIKIEIWVK